MQNKRREDAKGAKTDAKEGEEKSRFFEHQIAGANSRSFNI
jgi:hypothetical protein